MSKDKKVFRGAERPLLLKHPVSWRQADIMSARLLPFFYFMLLKVVIIDLGMSYFTLLSKTSPPYNIDMK